MRTLVRRILLEVVNVVCNNRLAFFVARKMQLFDAVFVMYPADASFADHYTFRVRQWFIRWRPFITGIITHPSGKRTLMFAISTFVDAKESEIEPHTARLFHDRVEKIAKRIGASSTHFAGTLPGKLSLLRVRRGHNQKNEREATEHNVIKAILQVRRDRDHKEENPVVIFGALGYIGKTVTEGLRKKGIQVIEVDKAVNVDGKGGVSYQKPSVPHVVANITRPEAFNGYVDHSVLSEGVVFLNEVYPAPHPDVVLEMKKYGAEVLHIGGVRASVWPFFPGEYQGAIPCCAALKEEEYTVCVVPL